MYTNVQYYYTHVQYYCTFVCISLCVCVHLCHCVVFVCMIMIHKYTILHVFLIKDHKHHEMSEVRVSLHINTSIHTNSQQSPHDVHMIAFLFIENNRIFKCQNIHVLTTQ